MEEFNWWKLGKWLVIMTVVTLTTFFITLHFTSNVEIVCSAVIIILIITIPITVKIKTVGAAAIITLVAVIITAATDAATEIPLVFCAILVSTASVGLAFVFIVFFLIIDIKKETTVSEKIIWLSLLGYFTITLLPMLGTVLHWW